MRVRGGQNVESKILHIKIVRKLPVYGLFGAVYTTKLVRYYYTALTGTHCRWCVVMMMMDIRIFGYIKSLGSSLIVQL